MTNICSTVILLLLTVKRRPAVVWNNWDEIGQPGGGPAAEKNFSPRDVPPVV